MQAFEMLVAEILEAEGYWVRRSFKIGLTKEEKVLIGRPSSPRWEIDLVAFKPSHTVLAVECKSFLDSPGVTLSDVQGGRYATRYKLFTEPTLRKVVLEALARDLVQRGLCIEHPEVRLALAAGKVRGVAQELRDHFDQQGWILFDREWLVQKLRALADGGYENSPALMAAKLLLRGTIEPQQRAT
jgi:hypothetical protein